MLEIPYVEEITENTDPEKLASMDVKDHGRYPIFLMTDKSGARGHDYRAPTCHLGICLLIASPFPDERTRV